MHDNMDDADVRKIFTQVWVAEGDHCSVVHNTILTFAYHCLKKKTGWSRLHGSSWGCDFVCRFHLASGRPCWHFVSLEQLKLEVELAALDLELTELGLEQVSCASP